MGLRAISYNPRRIAKRHAVKKTMTARYAPAKLPVQARKETKQIENGVKNVKTEKKLPAKKPGIYAKMDPGMLMTGKKTKIKNVSQVSKLRKTA
tara:strand:- start:210 stop:491 length:282 start_codon:yes stop_codon:yes gene_type:complete